MVSRNPENRDDVQHRVVSGGPVGSLLRGRFAPLITDEDEWKAFEALVQTLGDDEAGTNAAADTAEN